MVASANMGEGQPENRAEGKCPLRANWRCLCPRADWRTNQARSDATGAPVWIQWAADGALALLRHAYELSETSECSCTFAGYQSLFGGKKLTAYDDLGDALVAFDWVMGPRQYSYSSTVLYEELGRAAYTYCDPAEPCNCKAGALIEPPAAMAQRLLKSDERRRTMLAAAKDSQDLAAVSIPAGPSKLLKVMAIRPLHLLRFTAFQCGHVEHQLPEQKPLECIYLG